MPDAVKKPSLTVLLPVYNAAPYLREAVQSILNQTFTDFELLAINDGSTDESKSLLAEFNDERIRIIDNPQNLGLIATLNIGIDNAKSDFLARMDADDISSPERFEKQMNIFKKNPEAGVVGSWIKRFGAEESIVHYPTSDAEIKASLFFFNAMIHAGAIIRKRVLSENGIYYRKDYLDAEDYDLWFQLFRHTRFCAVPEVLYYWRIHQSQMGFVAPEASLQSTRRIKKEALSLFGKSFTEKEKEEWLNIVYQNPSHNSLTVQVLDKVVRANRKRGLVDKDIFERKVLAAWKNSFFKERKISFSTLKRFLFSPLSAKSRFTARQFVSVCKKSLFDYF